MNKDRKPKSGTSRSDPQLFVREAPLEPMKYLLLEHRATVSTDCIKAPKGRLKQEVSEREKDLKEEGRTRKQVGHGRRNQKTSVRCEQSEVLPECTTEPFSAGQPKEGLMNGSDFRKDKEKAKGKRKEELNSSLLSPFPEKGECPSSKSNICTANKPVIDISEGKESTETHECIPGKVKQRKREKTWYWPRRSTLIEQQGQSPGRDWRNVARRSWGVFGSWDKKQEQEVGKSEMLGHFDRDRLKQELENVESDGSKHISYPRRVVRSSTEPHWLVQQHCIFVSALSINSPTPS